jgi:hypothetical protein
MVNSDRAGKRWAYLETEERYQYIKTIQRKNLIVPLVADFAGPKTLKALAKYLKEHESTVSVFYISNVEDYLDGKWGSYVENLKALPQGLFDVSDSRHPSRDDITRKDPRRASRLARNGFR